MAFSEVLTRRRKPAVIYHSADGDGWMSATILKKYLAEHSPVMIPYNYGQYFDENQLEGITEIYLADITLPISIMQKYAGRIIWLDHHRSAIDNPILQGCTYRDNQATSMGMVEGERKPISGCELVWNYCYPDKPVPRCVRLFGRYDVWDKSYPEAWYLSAFIKYPSDEYPIHDPYRPFNEPWWDRLFDDKFLDEVVLPEGEDCYLFQQVAWKEEARKIVKIFDYFNHQGIRFCVANRGGISSEYFKTIYEKDPSIAVAIAYYHDVNASRVKLSFYTVNHALGISALSVMTDFVSRVNPKSVVSSGGHENACGAILHTVALLDFHRFLKPERYTHYGTNNYNRRTGPNYQAHPVRQYTAHY